PGWKLYRDPPSGPAWSYYERWQRLVKPERGGWKKICYQVGSPEPVSPQPHSCSSGKRGAPEDLRRIQAYRCHKELHVRDLDFCCLGHFSSFQIGSSRSLPAFSRTHAWAASMISFSEVCAFSSAAL